MVHQLGQNTLHSEKGKCTKTCFLCPMFNDKGIKWKNYIRNIWGDNTICSYVDNEFVSLFMDKFMLNVF